MSPSAGPRTCLPTHLLNPESVLTDTTSATHERPRQITVQQERAVDRREGCPAASPAIYSMTGVRAIRERPALVLQEKPIVLLAVI
jgi:hypothetical protein